MGKAPIIRIKSIILFATTTLYLWGCTTVIPADQGAVKLPVETLWSGNQSSHATSHPLALWITDSNQLKAMARANPNRVAAAILERCRVDWRCEAVVWLYMGHKTSGGYGLSLASPEATVSRRIAAISVHWREPRPGALVTQQLTSPCLVLKLPRGKYDKIEIRDETGRVRTRLAVKNVLHLFLHLPGPAVQFGVSAYFVVLAGCNLYRL